MAMIRPHACRPSPQAARAPTAFLRALKTKADHGAFGGSRVATGESKCRGPGFGARRLPVPGWGWDTLLLAFALLLGNLHLGGFGEPADWIFHPGRVAAGEWWRLFTHPFVHLSGYHLALDGAAFFLLYAELRRQPWPRRLAGLLLCSGGGLLAPWLWSPQVAALGLCGLSGTAHGLMARSGLEQMRTPRTRRAGLIVLGLVAGKSIIEGISGQVVFTFMHMGLCGTPIAMAHVGGVAGGIAAGLLAGGPKNN